MKRTLALTALLATFLVAGCGSGVNFVPEHDVVYAPKDKYATVDIYTGAINRPHVVIGTLTAEEKMKATFSDRSTYDTVVNKLKDKARRLGADALINAHPVTDPSSTVGTRLVVTAQAVKYMEAEVTMRSRASESTN